MGEIRPAAAQLILPLIRCSNVCVEVNGRLLQPWMCPVDGCHYTTVVKRVRPMHLLREHRLLFRGRGLSPTPLSDAEFNERIEAMRRRNRGGRQRVREVAAQR